MRMSFCIMLCFFGICPSLLNSVQLIFKGNKHKIMSIDDFYNPVWRDALKKLHAEMLEENQFWNEVSEYHKLTEDDILDMGEQHEDCERRSARTGVPVDSKEPR